MVIILKIKKLFGNSQLIKRMAYKEVTDRYAGSAFGVLWTLIQPIFIIAIYVIVFTFVFKIRINGDGSSTEYAFYAIAGLLPWLALSDGLAKSVISVYGKSPLVKQAIFPTEILPVSSIISSFIPFIFGLIFYTVALSFLNPNHLTGLYLLPLVMIIHLILLIGIGYFLAIGGVYFRDLSEIIMMLLTVGMFVTPILYLENSIPSKLAWAINLNPATHLINMYRDALYYGHMNHPFSFVLLAITAIIFFWGGLTSFEKVKHLFSNVL